VTHPRWRDAVTPSPPAALLKDGCISRENALDLLVADALVTYAFEAASDATPAAIIALGARAMTRIAAFAVPGDS